METITRHLDYNKFDNYISICIGLHLLTTGIKDFVVDHVQASHTTLYTKCSSGTCTNRSCSKKFKMLKDWCQSCRLWKAELKKLKSDEYRHWNSINWSQLSSSDWPQSIEEIAKVFVKNISINFRHGVFQDIGAVMSILTNMNIFALDKTTMKEIIRIRNDYYGHNYTAGIHDADKNIFFDRILHFIRLPAIRGYQSAIECTLALEELKNTKNLSQKLLQKLLDNNGLHDVRDVLLHNVPRIDSRERAIVVQDGLTADSQLYSDYKTRLNELIVQDKIKKDSEIVASKPCCKHLFQFLVKLKTRNTRLIRLLLFFTLFLMFKEPTADPTGCANMRFQHQWKSEIDFEFYIQELNKSSVVERIWLEPLVSSALKMHSHVLLTAHLGYGKSIIVSQILCSEVYSPWHYLKKMKIAYHMCRFDYKASIQSANFIRNLAGKIAKDVPELGTAILADEYALDYLEPDSFRCRQDPFLCLEIAIIAPLKHIQTDKKYLIIIDALDECDTPMGNDIYDLLAKKLSDFPMLFQFLFTSRKVSKVLYEFKTLQRVHEIDLDSFVNRNNLDAHRFIDKISNLSDENKSQLVKVSDGNLLHINSFINYCQSNKSCEFSKVPKTIEYIYYVNLKRIFGEKGASFEEWTTLFEVICAAFNPVGIEDLFMIAGLDDKNQKREFSKLQGNEFGHFLKQSDSKLSFQHKAFKDFLTNESRIHMPFYINITKGHMLFSNYYLNIHTPQNSLDAKVLIDVASHFALTNNTQTVNKFLQFYKTRLKDSTILIMLARDVNCYNTANLVIKLIEQSGLRSLNMSTAAFIASANANLKTLTSFLENKVNFKSKYNLPLEQLMKGADLVHMCKFVFFCGYNVFHIAAQRGYVEIVDYLLDKYPNILYEQNSIQLNAFQLAAENGHIQIVKLFLGINSSLADHHSLYYASQHGHDGIVSLLLNYVNDTCLPCNGTTYWLPTSSTRKQENVTFPIEAMNINSVYFQTLDVIQFNQMLKNAILLDDWRLITCESALNTAARNGHLRIVKSLLQKDVNALHCTMFDGSTPLLTASKYDQAEIFRYLHDSGANLSYRCKRNFSYDGKFETTEQNKLLEKICPENGSISHLLAIYDSYGIIKYLLSKSFEDWETRDSHGLTPSHYAFCCNSNNFIKFVVFSDTINLNLHIKSPNGSTSYHSAAVCKSVVLSHYLDSSVRKLPDTVDNENRSILHYGLMPLVSQEEAIQIDRDGKDYYTDLLFRVAMNNKHDYMRVDMDGRNILHYAASNGNYWAFMKVLQIREKSEISGLLFQKDNSGYTPLKAAFDSLTPRRSFESLKMPLNCSLNELFSTTCNSNLSVILSPHEYCIFKFSEYLSSTNYFTQSNVKEYLTLAINMSRIYPILVLKNYAHKEFDAIISSSTEIPTLIVKSDMHIMVEYIFNADNSLRCNKTESPLHQLVLNAMNGHDILPLNSFLIPMFKKFSSQYLDQCYDNDGYNLLHRAAMGGNVEAVRLMLSNGMNVSCMSKNGQNVLEICIYSSPFLKNGHVPSYYVSGSRFHILEYVFQSESVNISFDRTRTIDFDTTSDLLVEKIAESVLHNRLPKILCDNKNIGLIHVASAKGLQKFIKRVHSIFGSHCIQCRDKFNISPYYLAQIYGHTYIVKWMKHIQVESKAPEQIVQNMLIYNLISNYLTLSQHDWTCFQDFKFKYRALIRNQAIKCVRRYSSEKILFKNIYYMNISDSLFSSIFYDFEQSDVFDNETIHLRYIMETISKRDKNFVQLCSLSHIAQFVNIIRREFLLFNVHDREYFYRYFQARGKTIEEPLRDVEINELYQAVTSNKYQDLKKLQVRRDIHREWLHDLITENIGIDFDYTGFNNFAMKRLAQIVYRYKDVIQMGENCIIGRKNSVTSTEKPLTEENITLFVIECLRSLLSEKLKLSERKSYLKILFRDPIDKENVVFSVENYFKMAVYKGDNKVLQETKRLKLSIDKALQDRNWNKKDFPSESFHYVLTKYRDLYSKYFF